MTASELIHELQKLPEDCEILVRDITIKWLATIHDAKPIDGIEYDEDGTPIAWLQTE